MDDADFWLIASMVPIFGGAFYAVLHFLGRKDRRENAVESLLSLLDEAKEEVEDYCTQLEEQINQIDDYLNVERDSNSYVELSHAIKINYEDMQYFLLDKDQSFQPVKSCLSHLNILINNMPFSQKDKKKELQDVYSQLKKHWDALPETKSFKERCENHATEANVSLKTYLQDVQIYERKLRKFKKGIGKISKDLSTLQLIVEAI